MIGVEIIKTVYETDCSYTKPIFALLAALCLIALMLAKLGHAHTATAIVFTCLGLCVVTGIVSGFIQKPTDEIRYQEVAVSDEVSLNEFYSQYEIIEKIEDEAYTNIDSTKEYYKVKSIMEK